MAPDEDDIYQVSDSSLWLSRELIAVFLFLCLVYYVRRFISIKIFFRYIKQKSQFHQDQILKQNRLDHRNRIQVINSSKNQLNHRHKARPRKSRISNQNHRTMFIQHDQHIHQVNCIPFNGNYVEQLLDVLYIFSLLQLNFPSYSTSDNISNISRNR